MYELTIFIYLVNQNMPLYAKILSKHQNMMKVNH